MNFDISGKTKLTGLLGSPVSHSISPKMHNMAFQHLGLDYVYLAFDVREEGLKEAVAGLRSLGVVGFNLTMPHKQGILPLLDEISPEARLIGSVNTVLNDQGKLIGYNTDGKGYVKDLADKGITIRGKRIVMAGAGGAAKSIAIQLALEGAEEIVIFNRNLQLAEEISNMIKGNIPTCKTITLQYTDNQLKQSLENADLFINCTPLGMKPHEDKSIIASPDMLKSELIVSDLIYSPQKTKLLQMAEGVGCKTINGLGMLIGQGALAFKIWTGQEMPVALIKEKVF